MGLTALIPEPLVKLGSQISSWWSDEVPPYAIPITFATGEDGSKYLISLYFTRDGKAIRELPPDFAITEETIAKIRSQVEELFSTIKNPSEIFSVSQSGVRSYFEVKKYPFQSIGHKPLTKIFANTHQNPQQVYAEIESALASNKGPLTHEPTTWETIRKKLEKLHQKYESITKDPEEIAVEHIEAVKELLAGRIVWEEVSKDDFNNGFLQKDRYTTLDFQIEMIRQIEKDLPRSQGVSINGKKCKNTRELVTVTHALLGRNKEKTSMALMALHQGFASIALPRFVNLPMRDAPHPPMPNNPMPNNIVYEGNQSSISCYFTAKEQKIVRTDAGRLISAFSGRAITKLTYVTTLDLKTNTIEYGWYFGEPEHPLTKTEVETSQDIETWADEFARAHLQ